MRKLTEEELEKLALKCLVDIKSNELAMKMDEEFNTIQYLEGELNNKKYTYRIRYLKMFDGESND